jgi:hypothetical protein
LTAAKEGQLQPSVKRNSRRTNNRRMIQKIKKETTSSESKKKQRGQVQDMKPTENKQREGKI